jgi:hypothetical protein
MMWLRKLDWWLQITTIIIALCVIPFTGIYTILYAQTVLAGLQLISAGIHTLMQLPSFLRRGINNYWIVATIYIIILLLLNFTGRENLLQFPNLFLILYVIIPWITASYYLTWYRKLINYLWYHNELGGLIKS